jgi:hypothetical protein
MIHVLPGSHLVNLKHLPCVVHAALKKLCNHPDILLTGASDGEDAPTQEGKDGKSAAGSQVPARQAAGPSAASPWVPPGLSITQGGISTSGTQGCTDTSCQTACAPAQLPLLNKHPRSNIAGCCLWPQGSCQCCRGC